MDPALSQTQPAADPAFDRSWVMTAGGRPFFVQAPALEDFRVADLAHQLAARNRFNGATVEPYNVAHHSVLASFFMAEAWATCADVEGLTADEFAAYGLTHDGAEFLLPDLARPHKRMPEFAGVVALERRLQRWIYRAVGLDPDREPAALKLVDRRLLRTEQRHLMPAPGPGEIRDDVPPYELGTGGLKPWTWRESRDRFLEQFRYLESCGVLRDPHRGDA